MLVLSRRKGETIVIADNITLTVVEVRGDRVRLGITAPPDVSVARREVWAEMRGRADEPSPAPPPGED